jgi:hypothetical protein
LDPLAGQQYSSLLLSGSFRNPLSNHSLTSSFEATLLDQSSYLVHQTLTDLLLPPFEPLDFPSITLLSSNSSYGALSSYTFLFDSSSPQLLIDAPLKFLRIQLPDCFSANFTQLIAKVTRGAAYEYAEVYSINNSTRDFWFNCTCSGGNNFTLIAILNAPEGGNCISINKYFSVYNYEDTSLNNMIFKSE